MSSSLLLVLHFKVTYHSDMTFLVFFFLNEQLWRRKKVVSTEVCHNGLIFCVATYRIDIHCVGWGTGDTHSSKYIRTEEECGNSSRVYLILYGAMRVLPIQKN